MSDNGGNSESCDRSKPGHQRNELLIKYARSMFICLLWPRVAPCREALRCYNKDICSASAQNNPSNYSAVSSAVLIPNYEKPYF